MSAYGRGHRGSFRRASRRPNPYPRQRHDSEILPQARPDYMLTHDGSSQGMAVARAREEARLARDWKTLFSKMFERNEVEVRMPPKTHMVPAAEKLREIIDTINKETLTKWQEAIISHLTEVEENAEERAANPVNRDQQLLISTVATTIEATVKHLLEQMQVEKEKMQLEKNAGAE